MYVYIYIYIYAYIYIYIYILFNNRGGLRRGVREDLLEVVQGHRVPDALLAGLI